MNKDVSKKKNNNSKLRVSVYKTTKIEIIFKYTICQVNTSYFHVGFTHRIDMLTTIYIYADLVQICK